MTIVTDNREHFSQSFLLGREACRKTNKLLYKYLEVTNLATIKPERKEKKERKLERKEKKKKIAMNKTTALHKYRPDRPIVQFTAANKTSRRSFLD